MLQILTETVLHEGSSEILLSLVDYLDTIELPIPDEFRSKYSSWGKIRDDLEEDLVDEAERTELISVLKSLLHDNTDTEIKHWANSL
jgi:hypothetical protein